MLKEEVKNSAVLVFFLVQLKWRSFLCYSFPSAIQSLCTLPNQNVKALISSGQAQMHICYHWRQVDFCNNSGIISLWCLT